MYDALSEGLRSDEFAIARIRKVKSITTRWLYTRLLDELSKYNATNVPETYPHTADEVQQIVEDIIDQFPRGGATPSLTEGVS